LRECESLLAIERTQRFGLDDIVSTYFLIDRRYLSVSDGLAGGRCPGLQTATIAVGDERPAIIHHAKLDAFVR